MENPPARKPIKKTAKTMNRALVLLRDLLSIVFLVHCHQGFQNIVRSGLRCVVEIVEEDALCRPEHRGIFLSRKVALRDSRAPNQRYADNHPQQPLSPR